MKEYPDNDIEFYDYKGNNIESISSITGEIKKDHTAGRSMIKEIIKAEKDYKSKHCCEEMNFHLKNGEVHIYYDSKWRVYGIDYEEEYGEDIQIIDYCPWCGNKLPARLINEWWQIIEEMNVSDPVHENFPEEFKTDEWWIKRGL